MDAASVEAPRLRLCDLQVSYGSNCVLRGVSLDVSHGQIVAVLGRSGSGKTTLLRAACALLPLDRGSVSLDGQTIVEGPDCLYQPWEIRRRVMYVAQTPTLLPHLTALENIMLPLRAVRGMSRPLAAARAEELSGELQLDAARLRRYPEQLSGGEAQRVQLVRAMVLEPDVLLLDEVTANIDPETTTDVVDTLWLLRERSGGAQSIVIVTHIVDFATRFADKIVFLHEGLVHEEGAARTFGESAQRRETRQFLARHH